MIEKKFGKRGKKAAAAKLGISPAYLSDMCGDRRGISAEFAVKLSKVFGQQAADTLYQQSCWQDLADAYQVDRKGKARR